MIPSADKYAKAVSLWQEWNARINVISRRDTDCIFEHHILHSLAIAEYFRRFYGAGMIGNAKNAASMSGNALQRTCSREFAPTFLDLGCGGGFPGIPLAMEWPAAQFTLCDSIGKKVRVAQAVADGLELQNVSCVQARAEGLPGEWDCIVSRAVAPLETLYGWIKGRFRESLVCLKGGDVNEEISQLLRRYDKGPGALKPGQVRVWPISDWLRDEYYAGKYVIEVSSKTF